MSNCLDDDEDLDLYTPGSIPQNRGHSISSSAKIWTVYSRNKSTARNMDREGQSSESNIGQYSAMSNLAKWLNSNQLSDTIHKLDGNINLQCLLTAQDNDLRYDV